MPWAIAGGWAIDLAAGRLTRPHADVDVALFRADQDALRAALPRWTFEVVVAGTRVPWPAGTRLELPVHEVRARAPDGAEIELLLNERDGDDWVYRRDPEIRRPLARALRAGPGGLRLLAPEVVVLYKSKSPRATDQHDFDVALPLLDDQARAWLRAAIERREPAHPWAASLDDGRDVLGLERGRVRLAAPTPRWALLFEREAARLAQALGPRARRIEHYGSTSVPGLVAKPILDVLVGAEAVDDPAPFVAALAPLGYEHASWAGVPGHLVFGRGQPRTHLVHVVRHGGPEWVRAIRFRDALRADAALAAAYAALKTDLAARHAEDRAAYTAAKTSFVARVLGDPPDDAA